MRRPGLVDPVGAAGLFASVVVGGLAGTLPDILEPPVSPNHRGFYHSAAFLGLTAAGGVWAGKKIIDSKWSPAAKMSCICLLLIVFLGVASHVVMDWTTPAGFNLIG
jgi:membrane-bound metal-dependent hydrolase YbcI (DUF457 family)